LSLGQVEVLKEVGVTIPDESLVNESIAAANGRASAPDWTAARKQALAVCFIRGANAIHKTYLTHLRNSFLDGSDYYPSTLHEAYNILLQRRVPEGGSMNIAGQCGRKAWRRQGQNLDHITCFKCGEIGHYASNCPLRNQGEQGGTNLCTCGMEETHDGNGGFSFLQSGTQVIPANWLLLDN
jgi:hypothetical protein